MVGEQSRELSVKVFAGQCRSVEKGFRQGGTAGYGLRRLLVTSTASRKRNFRSASARAYGRIG